MQVIKCIIAFVVIASSFVTFLAAQVYVSMAPVRVPGINGIADWQPSRAEIEAEKLSTREYYAKFQMVIDESRLVDFGAGASAFHDLDLPHGDAVTVSFTEKNKDNRTTHYLFECERCYMQGNVSGGRVIAKQGEARWQLDFMQVGEHGILFTNEIPPNWVLESNCGVKSHKELALNQVSERLLKSFGEIYFADLTGDELRKCNVSRDIVAELIQLMDHEF